MSSPKQGFTKLASWIDDITGLTNKSDYFQEIKAEEFVDCLCKRAYTGVELHILLQLPSVRGTLIETDDYEIRRKLYIFRIQQ